MAYKLELKLNKRADISITILVIGVFAVCTLAIVSFLLGQGNQGNFANTEVFENLSSQVENFYLYVNAGYTLQESAEKIGAQLQDNKLILNARQEKATSFLASITKQQPDVIMSVEYGVDLNK